MGKGLSRVKALCAGGDIQACHASARFSPAGTTEEIKEASGYAEKACKAGVQLSCVKLGFFLIQNEKTTRDEKNVTRALLYFKGACDAGVGQGCFSLALAHLEGKGKPQNIGEGIRLMTKACENLDTRGCAKSAALLRHEGRVAEARALLEIGCKAEDSESCAQLAFLLSKDTPPDYPRAAALFSAACTQGHVHSCFNYAVMLHKGQGVAPQPRRATMLLKESCRLGVKEACQVTGE